MGEKFEINPLSKIFFEEQKKTKKRRLPAATMSSTDGANVSAEAMERELNAKTRQLESLAIQQKKKEERLSDLEQTVKRGKESLDEKKTNLASTERAVRDGNVVNNRMIQDIQLKTNQHKQIEQAEAEILIVTENDLDYQSQLMADQYNFLKMVAGHLLPSKRKHSVRLDGNGDGIDAQKSVDALEIELALLKNQIGSAFLNSVANPYEEARVEAGMKKEMRALQNAEKEWRALKAATATLSNIEQDLGLSSKDFEVDNQTNIDWRRHDWQGDILAIRQAHSEIVGTSPEVKEDYPSPDHANASSVRLVIDEGKRTPTPSGRKIIRRTGGFNLSPNEEMPQIPEELNGSDPQMTEDESDGENQLTSRGLQGQPRYHESMAKV